jgi:hypothetical protein
MIYLISLLLSVSFAADKVAKPIDTVEIFKSKRNPAISYVFLNLTDCMFEIATARADDVEYVDKMIEARCEGF